MTHAITREFDGNVALMIAADMKTQLSGLKKLAPIFQLINVKEKTNSDSTDLTIANRKHSTIIEFS